MNDYLPIIAVDFDGTLCENKWPDIGAPNEELFSYLKLQQQRYGVRLILWTCRSGERLQKAVSFCSEHGLEFDAINENLPDVVALYGDNTRKISADVYIDDKASHMFNLPHSTNEHQCGVCDIAVLGKGIQWGYVDEHCGAPYIAKHCPQCGRHLV